MRYAELIQEVSEMAKSLVIMAGGAGSRFGGDKQFAHIGPSGEILMEYSVYDALKAGFNRFIFVVRPGMTPGFTPLLKKIELASPDAEFICAEQLSPPCFTQTHPKRTKPLGTVHALLSAAPYLDGSFAVINADDYYGRPAFEAMADAMENFSGSQDAAIMLYSLKNTLSRYGAVTRGICKVNGDFLGSIREAFKVIESVEHGAVELIEEEYIPLSATSPVSMNFWAFHSDIIPEFTKYFEDFLAKLGPDDNKSECLLPIMAEHFLEKGTIRVRALPTNCRWFGLTYREDATDAAWELDKRHADGTYPEKLF